RCRTSFRRSSGPFPGTHRGHTSGGNGRDVGDRHQLRPHGERLSIVGLCLLLHQQSIESACPIYFGLGDGFGVSLPTHPELALFRVDNSTHGASGSVLAPCSADYGTHSPFDRTRDQVHRAHKRSIAWIYVVGYRRISDSGDPSCCTSPVACGTLLPATDL